MSWTCVRDYINKCYNHTDVIYNKEMFSNEDLKGIGKKKIEGFLEVLVSSNHLKVGVGGVYYILKEVPQRAPKFRV